ncbi:hypothetical protein HNY73_016377 [Argiope bruennichi]|uniref:Uncharacterized protein n=1 Tax=Argiope bruennichi TaxID=94029 RepID=A0A8T0EJX6_ARGBR|nr:hypothetical protein HNY73_016377 [Argiope bruennichi]
MKLCSFTHGSTILTTKFKRKYPSKIPLKNVCNISNILLQSQEDLELKTRSEIHKWIQSKISPLPLIINNTSIVGGQTSLLRCTVDNWRMTFSLSCIQMLQFLDVISNFNPSNEEYTLI